MFRKERCHVHFGTPDGVFLLPPPRETGCGHGFQAAAGRLQDGADHLRCSPVVHLLIGVKGEYLLPLTPQGCGRGHTRDSRENQVLGNAG